MTKSETPKIPWRLRTATARTTGGTSRRSAARNRGPIREVLEKILPKSGIALEIGSGTGEHVICFAKALPGLLWQPSDPDPASRASIAAWIAAEGLANVRAPVGNRYTAGNLGCGGRSAVCRDGVAQHDPHRALGVCARASRWRRTPLAAGRNSLSLRAFHEGRRPHSTVQRRLRRRPQEARPELGRSRYR